MPYSDIARDYLLSEGIPADRIIKTGSPMFEVLNYYRMKIENSNILEKLGLEEQKYFVVSSHREENIASGNFNNMLNMLNFLAEEYKLPVIVSTHPRTRKAIDSGSNKNMDSNILFMKPLGFSDYNKLQY
jgi:UDP-N-acetylglucosamine 2-epimerase (non-hydrolysing)